MSETEARPVSLSEARAGVKLRSGHSVVLIISGLKGNQKDAGAASFELHVQLHAAGGTPLAGERLKIQDPSSGEIVGTVTADEAGVVRARVPKQAEYHFLLEDGGAAEAEADPFAELPAPEVPSEQDHALLSLALSDAKGSPLAGEKIRVEGPGGVSHDEVTDAAGHLLLAVSPGVFRIAARGASFVAHSLFDGELDGEDPPYQFVVR